MFHYKEISIKFLILVLICMRYEFQSVSGKIGCIKEEREALLSFKQEVTSEYGELSSWGSEDDCCNWTGVDCSNTTGHVTAVVLSSLNIEIGGNINSLVTLQSLKTLEYLDLRWCDFSGRIPPQLGNLTNLRSLDLAYNYGAWSDNLNWLSHLPFLSNLDLTYTNISGDTNWLQHVLKLPSLQKLWLGDCMLTDVRKSSVLSVFVNSSSTSLSFLYLSNNDLTSSTFDWLFNISVNLVRIDLDSNKLDGAIPDAFANMFFLQHLDLSGNTLTHGIPKSLGHLGQLRRLYLGSNRLTGSVPASLGQLSKLEYLYISFNSLNGTISEAHLRDLHSLKTLDLSSNSLTINLSDDWIPPFRLDRINLASCKIGPSFPAWLRTQTNLYHLDISVAGISDEVPNWLWYNSTFFYLNISHNQISGTIPDLSSNSISILDVSFNKLTGPVPSLHPETLVVQLSSNMFSGSISSICPYAYCQLQWLDLSSNQLVGALPSVWENMKDLVILNVNYNNLSGEIPHSLGSLWNLKTLHLRYNNFSGELPSTLKNCGLLQQIDIGGNRFTGSIPPWLGENYTSLAFLSLPQNRFHGSIPPEICKLTQIQLLDLSENNITGEIPECFDNFSALVEKNKTTSTWISILDKNVLPQVYALVQWKGRKKPEYTKTEKDKIFSTKIFIPRIVTYGYMDYTLVQWKGKKSEYTKTLGLLKLIDLSSNGLVGSIPKSFSKMKQLISLNFSRNSLTGNIIPDIGQMEALETLDLSRNQLSGEIPEGLARLTSLDVLDLANNNLSGRIPTGTQLQSFNQSVYAGNAGLCGKPLSLCPQDDVKPSTTDEGEDMEEKDEGFWRLSFMQGFGISMAFGFIVGFWGVVGSFIVKRSWRNAYFNLLDAIWDWLYVTVTIFLTKFR